MTSSRCRPEADHDFGGTPTSLMTFFDQTCTLTNKQLRDRGHRGRRCRRASFVGLGAADVVDVVCVTSMTTLRVDGELPRGDIEPTGTKRHVDAVATRAVT